MKDRVNDQREYNVCYCTFHAYVVINVFDNVFFEWKQICSVRFIVFFISVLPLEIQLSKGEEGFNLSSWLWIWRTKTWITISMCLGLFLGSMIWGINCGRAKPLRVFPLDNWISNNNIDINKRINTYTYSLPLNNTTYYHKNEVHHKHGQYNTRVNQCA